MGGREGGSREEMREKEERVGRYLICHLFLRWLAKKLHQCSTMLSLTSPHETPPTSGHLVSG